MQNKITKNDRIIYIFTENIYMTLFGEIRFISYKKIKTKNSTNKHIIFVNVTILSSHFWV